LKRSPLAGHRSVTEDHYDTRTRSRVKSNPVRESVGAAGPVSRASGPLPLRAFSTKARSLVGAASSVSCSVSALAPSARSPPMLWIVDERARRKWTGVSASLAANSPRAGTPHATQLQGDYDQLRESLARLMHLTGLQQIGNVELLVVTNYLSRVGGIPSSAPPPEGPQGVPPLLVRVRSPRTETAPAQRVCCNGPIAFAAMRTLVDVERLPPSTTDHNAASTAPDDAITGSPYAVDLDLAACRIASACLNLSAQVAPVRGRCSR
jgi:hypothetical protein